jgi:hypothetical protein
MCQVYSGPGSPYFAGMGFLGLAAPAGHPLWTEPEHEQPAERGEYVRTLHGAGWVIQAAGGVVHAANHGGDHVYDPDAEDGDAHYAALGYSTHTAPGVGDAWTAAVDGNLALVDEWGRATHRAGLRGTVTGEGWAASWHRPRFGGAQVPGARVTSLSILRQGVELRAHLVIAPPGWTVREGSFAVAAEIEPEADGTSVRTEEVTVDLIPLHGWTGSGLARYRGGNAFGEYSAVPYLTAEPAADVPTVYVSVHRLARTATADTAATADMTAGERTVPVRVEVDGDRIRATWTGGGVDEFVLGALFD